MSSAFKDAMAESGTPILLEQLGESVEYASANVPEGAQVWETIDGAVTDPADPRGVSDARNGRDPIVVYVAKSEISTVVLQRDRIRIGGADGEVFLVADKEDDGGGWELYCVQ